jgi:hypothetical protein
MNLSDFASSTTGASSNEQESTPKRRKTLRLPGSSQTTPIKVQPDRIINNPELASPEKYLDLANEDVSVSHLLAAGLLAAGDVVAMGSDHDDNGERRGRVQTNGSIVADGKELTEIDWSGSTVLNIGWRASSFPQKLGIVLSDLRRTFIGLVREYAENNGLQTNLEEEDEDDEDEDDDFARNNNGDNNGDGDSDSIPTQKAT